MIFLHFFLDDIELEGLSGSPDRFFADLSFEDFEEDLRERAGEDEGEGG